MGGGPRPNLEKVRVPFKHGNNHGEQAAAERRKVEALLFDTKVPIPDGEGGYVLDDKGRTKTDLPINLLFARAMQLAHQNTDLDVAARMVQFLMERKLGKVKAEAESSAAQPLGLGPIVFNMPIPPPMPKQVQNTAEGA